MVKTCSNFTSNLQSAFAQIPFTKKLQTQTVSKEKHCKTFAHEKFASKMLLKLTPAFKNGVFFTRKLSLLRLNKKENFVSFDYSALPPLTQLPKAIKRKSHQRRPEQHKINSMT